MLELRGKLVADQLKDKCLDFVNKYNGLLPTLAIIRVGEKPDDVAYERNIKKRFISYGLEAKTYEMPENVSNEEFQETFDFINRDPEIHGIIVMRPLPKQIDEKAMLMKLNPLKDVDCITPANVAGVMSGDPEAFAPCTAQAVVEILKAYHIPMEGKNACIIGRSMVVGRPLAMLLLKENCTVTICHSKTEELQEVSRKADILVAAVGRPKMVNSSYVKTDATVLDVGINVDKDGNLVGDCDWDTVTLNAGAATPVPGGVGTVTTAVLATHVVEAAKKQIDFSGFKATEDSYLEEAWNPTSLSKK